ncbi:hypothetical protein BX616_009067 [Lobosporangium transversale]|uniref:GPI biosynthesis protein family Pig-F-domain-containing protein n=1 Tax=Lobosporangium transversale TaxID=64571 RepID=A0A1Y2GDP3_9FUNG|nr:GPI biosynthesis protein family Pig-F-domain-containing protein [Lobosporangium transversale]KAF9918385.1 hypothetical protein BX616_009067 [Lobosporangium transversale]ORZ07980.1 GPI biosynthesis protein family Pig-F-domain-containing protein [Lobosporangium transversale]|eukprot:XP_021878214.1 GPI biosynthesis protein family Pig-F-domain-containing protein [Lobosporangium transversale]
MQRTTRQGAGKGGAPSRHGSSETVLAPPSFPLLKMTLIAMVNLATAYSTLTWIPAKLIQTNISEHQTFANNANISSDSSVSQTLPSLSWTLIVLFGFQTLVGLAQAYLHSKNTAVNKKISERSSQLSSSPFAILSVSMTIGAVGASVCHLFAVLFGAGIFHQSKETGQLALYLSLLTFYPASFVLGTDFKNWIRIFVHNSPRTFTEAALYCQGMMAIFGAWLGSIVIPLDWDRPWQAWPVPCVLGASLFYCIGVVVGLVVSIVMHQRVARSEFGVNLAEQKDNMKEHKKVKGA